MEDKTLQSDHDLLIRIETKVDGIENDIKHQSRDHKLDLKELKEALEKEIKASGKFLKKDIDINKEDIKDLKLGVQDWRFSKRYILGAGAVIGIIWPIIWVLIQRYW